MHIIWTLLIGLAVGLIAKLVTPGKDPGGAVMTMLLGVAGAFIAGSLGRAGGWYGPNEEAGLIASVLGAIVVLVGYRLIAGGKAA
ncbi:MAG: GlsB/YeaQ/YmgE family stress response membrane protein [Kofleriaceae bacterium]